ncbi:helix-turn-helix transcriptional regulator [Streptomyces sp. CNQ085]|uniref:helix-turn-helix domain-containing protein n=1 Tax=Streptomyces sp. CNQ085 TaxID=2886944 RepID=UPI001F50AF66|nr:helix-turn-helix transcriptional regulator [Streptomyces sp. CNQ085]MCI0385996.1 helix-turn-helix domain-containing protein [Streptomyces sp. CNQ085]
MQRNQDLRSRMLEAGLTQEELAEAVNLRLRADGHEGTVSDRTVRNWLAGKTVWPHARQRQALEAVFGRAVEELGFTPPAGRQDTALPPPQEDPVRRRHFLTATTGTTAAAVPLVAASRPSSVGTSDVIRLREGLEALTTLDQSRGGHDGLERTALSSAGQALRLQERAASQRIRQRLFGVAADYTAAAAWSAIDARHPEHAQRYLDRALYLSRMSKNHTAELRVWNSYAMLARESRNYTQAVDAAQAAQTTTAARRDPFLASLAHARTATGHAYLGDRQAALRSLGYAEEALSKADPGAPRPSWTVFYGPGELHGLTSIVHHQLGDPAKAEAAAHRDLAATPARFRRNRALATVWLALAQLHQHDVEQACATAETVFDLMEDDPLPGRMRSLLGDFHRDLITIAPDSAAAREWGDRHRNEWTLA